MNPLSGGSLRRWVGRVGCGGEGGDREQGGVGRAMEERGRAVHYDFRMQTHT